MSFADKVLSSLKSMTGESIYTIAPGKKDMAESAKKVGGFFTKYVSEITFILIGVVLIFLGMSMITRNDNG